MHPRSQGLRYKTQTDNNTCIFLTKHIILCLPQSNVIAFPWSCPSSTLLLGNFVGSFRQLKLSTVDRTTRKYFFQTFTSLHLVQNDILMFIIIFISIKCPERHFHSEIIEFDISISDPLVSAILILLVTLAPLTGFHVRLVKGVRLRSSLCHKNSSFPAINVADCRFISNHSIQLSERITLAICFLSCEPVCTYVARPN